MSSSSCCESSFLEAFMEYNLSQMVRDSTTTSKLLDLVLSHAEQAVSIEVSKEILKCQFTSDQKPISMELLVGRHEALQKDLKLFNLRRIDKNDSGDVILDSDWLPRAEGSPVLDSDWLPNRVGSMYNDSQCIY